MADPIEVALTIVLTVGGWIVATRITVWSIRSAHREEVKSQQTHDDVVWIFRPLRNEMERVLADSHQIGKGRSMWSLSEEFVDIQHRGLLQPARHDGVRREVETLVTLHSQHQSLQSNYYDSVLEALDTVFQSAKVNGVGGEERPLRTVIGVDFHDDRFHLALAGNGEEWLDMFKRFQANADAVNARVVWSTMSPDPGEMFADLEELTSDKYRAYRDSANALLAQAKKIKGMLDEALREAG